MAPAQLSVWSVNMSAILLSWQCTDELKIGYILFCHQHDNPTNYWVQNVTTPNSCVHLEEEGIAVGSSHVFTCMVASFNEFGFGPFSDPVNIVPQFDGMLLDCSI